MNASTSFRRQVPKDAAVTMWRAPDGWELRRFDWPGSGRGSILFQCGRADVFEKYLETFSYWNADGWSVTSLDWRGQGGSGRLSGDARVGHVDTFGNWVSDLGAFWPEWCGSGPGPCVAMGHSMGGHLLLQAMLEGAVRPDASVLVAPMTGLRGPIGARWAERVVRFMRDRGDPARAAWKAGERPGPKLERQTILTSDRSRYEDEQWWYEQEPDIKLGPPSWSWLTEAYASTRIQRGDPRIATLKVPILMLVAEADELVDAEASVDIANRLPDARLLRFGRESAHEILREADDVRDRALSAIRVFLDSRAPATVTRFDVAIVGGGIAGATLAAAIGTRARVVILEGEDAAGYHATGRSAAFWSETYGGPAIQPLTSASAQALTDGGYLQPLGSLHVGRAEDEGRADAFLAEFAGSGVPLERCDPREHVPGLREAWRIGVREPTCAYIDVARLHADALATVRRSGGEIRLGAELTGATREAGGWRIATKAGEVRADVLVNAAGAWADAVAAVCGVRRIGVHPFRRTMVQLRTDPAPAPALPHVAALSGAFYFKPEAGGRLWLSPHDETPTDACDAAAEELDVATAIDRLEGAVDWRVVAVERAWAGLRSFAADRRPVYGFDARTPGFFWCAGQGGFGIQTAPAAAALAAALLLGDGVPAGLDADLYAAARFG